MTATATASDRGPSRQSSRGPRGGLRPGLLRGLGATPLPVVLVVGGSALAPLNLLLVRSLSAYDVVIGVAMVLLWRRGLLRPLPKRYLAASYLFLAAALVSAFRATHTTEALTQILQYAFIFFVQLPVLVSVLRTRRAILLGIGLLCLGTVAATLHAYLTQPTQGAGRVLVFYSENPNRLGYPTAYVLPFLYVLWRAARHTGPRVRTLAAGVCLAAAGLSVWALFASGSRSSVLGTLVALVVLGALRPQTPLPRVLLRLAALAGALAAVVAALLASGALPGTLQERVARSFDDRERASLVADREHLMNAGLEAFRQSPLVGTGLDNFRYVALDYDGFATPQLPHNLWLQLAVQVGLVGTLAFAALLAMWLRDLLRAYRAAAGDDRDLVWAHVAVLAGVLTIFLFAPELLDRHYWLMVGLGLAAAHVVAQPTPAPGGAR